MRIVAPKGKALVSFNHSGFQFWLSQVCKEAIPTSLANEGDTDG